MFDRFNNVNFARAEAERLTAETGEPHDWAFRPVPQRDKGLDPYPFVVVKTAPSKEKTLDH